MWLAGPGHPSSSSVHSCLFIQHRSVGSHPPGATAPRGLWKTQSPRDPYLSGPGGTMALATGHSPGDSDEQPGPGDLGGRGYCLCHNSGLGRAPWPDSEPNSPASQAQLSSTEWLRLSPFSSPWQPGGQGRCLAVLIITWVTTIPPLESWCWGDERTVEILGTRGTEQLLVPPPLPLALPRDACVCSTNARRHSEHLVSELRIPQSATRALAAGGPERW